MLRALFRKQMLELNQGFFRSKRTGKARSRASSVFSILMFVLLMVGVLGGMFFYVSWSLSPLIQMGLGWLYFTMMGLAAVALGIFGSVFNTFASLYQAKDNDLLLSLPVPVPAILVVRLAGVYLMGLMYSGVVLLPTLIIYGITARPGVGAMACSVLFALLLSVFVLTLSCGLGWVVAKVNARLKNKSFITVLVSLLFLAAYYYVYFKANSMLQNLVANSAALAAGIKGAAYPLYLFGRAGEGSWPALLAVGAVVLVLFGLVYFLLSRSFLNIATSSSGGAKARYRERRVKAKGTGGALFSRELARFLASPTYMLNCALGTLLLVAAAVLVVVKGGWVREMMEMVFPGNPGVVPLLGAAGVCVMAAMNDITAPSVTLEGKTLWLLQSLPVPPWQALRAKLNLHLALTEPPALLCGVCMAAVLRPAPAFGLLMALAPLAFGLFSAALGLAINLKVPNLNWTSETAAVKQSVGVLLALLAGWGYTLVLALAYLAAGSRMAPELYLLACTVVTLAVSALLLHWLRVRGAKIFAAL